MNCTAARDLLPEHALGVAGVKGRAVQEHLAWCAACRRESADLQRASAVLAFTLAPAQPPPGLEDAIVAQVRTATGVGPVRRRSGRAVAVLLAAALGIAGVAGGTVLARRDPGPIQSVILEQQRAGLDRLRRVLASSNLAEHDTQASLAVLTAVDGVQEIGRAHV